MTSDARQRLRSLRDELASIEPWPWNNIAAWAVKATPMIRRDWPDDLDDFRKAIASPRWTLSWFAAQKGGDVAATSRTTDDATNAAAAHNGKVRILSFLEGLLAATEPTATSASRIVNNSDPLAGRQQILEAVSEIQGDSIEYTTAEQVAKRLGLKVEDVEGHFEILYDEDRLRFSRSDKGCSAFLMPGHRQRFKESQMTTRTTETLRGIPVEITESLERFREDYPDPTKVAFVMMRFGSTSAHKSIIEAIRLALKPFGIAAVRADERQYHHDLWPNIRTYLFGCGFGIAVFERIEDENFNPNVALEVGYLYGVRKPVCLLKDKTLKILQTDIIGELYCQFDPLDPKRTIPPPLKKWISDNRIA